MSRTFLHASRAARVFLAAGLLALGYAAYVVADTRMYQGIEQKRFENLRGNAAAAPALAVGSVMGEIRIPRLALSAMVVQGDSPSVLRRAVGHLAGTALGSAPDRFVVRARETRTVMLRAAVPSGRR